MKSIDYFKNWMDHISESEARNYIYEIFSRSKFEYNQLINKLINYQKNQHIQNIVIVTYTAKKNIC